MARLLSGKAEIVLDYPDKALIETFGQADQCHARFEANDVLLSLQRGDDDTGACRSMHFKLEPQVLTRSEQALAETQGVWRICGHSLGRREAFGHELIVGNDS